MLKSITRKIYLENCSIVKIIKDMDNDEQKASKEKQALEKKEFFKRNPYKNPIFLSKLTGFALLGTIGWLPLEGGTTTLSQSHLGNLILLIFLITALYKIAMKKPSGWLWFAGFFFYGAFAHIGVVAWLYVTLAGLALFVHKRWSQDI
jgi:hypothetical protein